MSLIATVGPRFVVDTDIGARYIFPTLYINKTMEEAAGDLIDQELSFYGSATLTYNKSQDAVVSPIGLNEQTLILDSDDVYLQRTSVGNGTTITKPQVAGVGNNIVLPSGFDLAQGFVIIITLDNKWIPEPYTCDGNHAVTDTEIIYATGSAFGNISFSDTLTIRLQQNLSTLALLGDALRGAPIPEPESDPYAPIPVAEPGGGMTEYDPYDSDDIDEPDDPELSAVSTGFVSLWSPTIEQMLDLSAFMWNADFTTIEFWKKLIANPLDLIYGLNIVPMDLGSYIDGAGNVVVGLINTGIQMDHLSTQWITVNCGYIDLDELWGAYLDYDPYTKLEIYLPFCGVHPLKVDDFMPGRITVTYKIDLVTGSCVALVKSTKTNKHDDTLNSIVYQFMGNCATQVPVTAAQYSDAVRSAISIAASIGSMIATGVGGAAGALGASKATGAASVTARTIGAELNTGASIVENVMNLKPSIERSGAMGSSASLLAVRSPYLIFTRPRMARPEQQNVYTGYPSFITKTLGDLNGWTKVQAIHLEGIPCTSEEMAEIDTLLQTGVIM